MNLSALYERFIQDRQGRSPVPFERHHVIPRCLGGTDHPDNLVRLSPGDHLFAHIVLGRTHGGQLAVCAVRMLGMSKYQGRRSRLQYADLRKEHARVTGDRSRGKPSPFSEEARTKAVLNSARTNRLPESVERLKRQAAEMSADPRVRAVRSQTMGRLNGSTPSFAQAKRRSLQERARLRAEAISLMKSRPLPEGLTLPANSRTGGTLRFWSDLCNRLKDQFNEQ